MKTKTRKELHFINRNNNPFHHMYKKKKGTCWTPCPSCPVLADLKMEGVEVANEQTDTHTQGGGRDDAPSQAPSSYSHSLSHAFSSLLLLLSPSSLFPFCFLRKKKKKYSNEMETDDYTHDETRRVERPSSSSFLQVRPSGGRTDGRSVVTL